MNQPKKRTIDELENDKLEPNELMNDELEPNELMNDELETNELENNKLEPNELMNDELEIDAQKINYFDWLPTVVIGVIMQFVECAYRGMDLKNHKSQIARRNYRNRLTAIEMGLPITPEMNQTGIGTVIYMSFLQYRLISKKFNEAVKMCIPQWSLFLEKYGPKHIGEDSVHIAGVTNCRLNKKGKCYVAKHYQQSSMKSHYKAEDNLGAYKTAITIFGEKHLRWVGKKIIRKSTRQAMLNATWPDAPNTLNLAKKLRVLERKHAQDKVAYKNATGKDWKGIVVKTQLF